MPRTVPIKEGKIRLKGAKMTQNPCIRPGMDTAIVRMPLGIFVSWKFPRIG